MAKKTSASRADAVREAAEQAFRAQIPRERISDLLDELGSTANRLRGAVDELRPASDADVKALRAEVRALAERVQALEAKPRRAPRRKTGEGAVQPAAQRRRKAATKPPDGAS